MGYSVRELAALLRECGLRERADALDLALDWPTDEDSRAATIRAEIEALERDRASLPPKVRLRVLALAGSLRRVPPRQLLPDDLAAALEPHLSDGSITVSGDDEPVWSFINDSLPFVGAGVDWKAAGVHLCLPVQRQLVGPHAPGSTGYWEAAAPLLRQFFEATVALFGGSFSERVRVVGDAGYEGVLEGRLSDVLECLPELFGWPLETFVIPVRGGWIVHDSEYDELRSVGVGTRQDR